MTLPAVVPIVQEHYPHGEARPAHANPCKPQLLIGTPMRKLHLVLLGLAISALTWGVYVIPAVLKLPGERGDDPNSPLERALARFAAIEGRSRPAA
jgi:hypothetical protein